MDEATRAKIYAMMTDSANCDTCIGCGKVADDDDQTPWIEWEAIPSPNNIAVQMGLVRPVTCPTCGGSGAKNG